MALASDAVLHRLEYMKCVVSTCVSTGSESTGSRADAYGGGEFLSQEIKYCDGGLQVRIDKGEAGALPPAVSQLGQPRYSK
jgi:hypothetical protein